MNNKIEQHFYTRERRGLYRHSAGYDSIAKSCGLTDAFVKEKIHPYCVYSPPTPKSFTVAHYPCGRMLFGQTAYVPADFTGRRSTFFSHNYIIPPESVGDFLSDMDRLLRTDFETSYDIGLGGVLQSVQHHALNDNIAKDLPWNRVGSDVAGSYRRIALSQIIKSLYDSIGGAKKTYVVTPNPPETVHDYACGLLAELYRHLPEYITHQLGFCTFSREPEKKKGIHLVFLEEGSALIGDSRMAGNFVVHICGEEENNRLEIETLDSTDSYLLRRLPLLSPERFFREINFWRVRLPSHRECLDIAEHTWLDKHLDTLSPALLATIPQDFIRRGINGGCPSASPSVYVMLSIMKTAVRATPLDMRYFLGSYFLSPADYERVTYNLQRLRVQKTESS